MSGRIFQLARARQTIDQMRGVFSHEWQNSLWWGHWIAVFVKSQPANTKLFSEASFKSPLVGVPSIMHSKKQVACSKETGSCFKLIVKFSIEAASALAIALERGELWRWIGSTHFGHRRDRRDSRALIPFIPATMKFEM